MCTDKRVFRFDYVLLLLWLVFFGQNSNTHFLATTVISVCESDMYKISLMGAFYITLQA